MGEIQFKKSRPFTLGVEIEFQILDKETLDLSPQAQRLIEKAPAGLLEKLAPEFLQSIIEVQTGICDNITEVTDDLRGSISALEESAAENDCLLYAASLHPFAEPSQQLLTKNERYERIMKELQYVGRQFISQGLHIHIGISNSETVIRICDIIQGYLPLFLGLSTSSPFFRREDTGLFSYRTKLFEALPLAGLSGYIGSWLQYEQEVTMLQDRQVIREPRDLWWDVRPSPGFGTVEVRICDLPSRFSEIVALAALIQAFCLAIVELDVPSARVSLQLLRCNKWQAARHGLGGRFNDPFGLLSTTPQTVGQAGYALLEFLLPYMQHLKSGQYADIISNIIEEGTSAARQRQLVNKGADFKEMINHVRREFWT